MKRFLKFYFESILLAFGRLILIYYRTGHDNNCHQNLLKFCCPLQCIRTTRISITGIILSILNHYFLSPHELTLTSVSIETVR